MKEKFTIRCWNTWKMANGAKCFKRGFTFAIHLPILKWKNVKKKEKTLKY